MVRSWDASHSGAGGNVPSVVMLLRHVGVVLRSLEAKASVADHWHNVLGPKCLFKVNQDEDNNHQAHDDSPHFGIDVGVGENVLYHGRVCQETLEAGSDCDRYQRPFVVRKLFHREGGLVQVSAVESICNFAEHKHVEGARARQLDAGALRRQLCAPAAQVICTQEIQGCAVHEASVVVKAAAAVVHGCLPLIRVHVLPPRPANLRAGIVFHRLVVDSENRAQIIAGLVIACPATLCEATAALDRKAIHLILEDEKNSMGPASYST